MTTSPGPATRIARHIRPRTRAQALAAARTVFECRLVVADNKHDAVLFALEKALYNEAQRLTPDAKKAGG